MQAYKKVWKTLKPVLVLYHFYILFYKKLYVFSISIHILKN